MLKRFNFFTNGEVRVRERGIPNSNSNALNSIERFTGIAGGGSKFLAIGDSNGQISFMNRAYSISLRVQAHRNYVNAVYQLKSKRILVTIGDGPTPGSAVSTLDAEVKFWHVTVDPAALSSGQAGVEEEEVAKVELARSFTLGSVLAKEKSKPYWAGDGPKEAHFVWPSITCIDVTEDLTQMAIGFSDGHVLLVRSDPFYDTSTPTNALSNLISNELNLNFGASSSAEARKGSNLLLEKGHVYTTLQTFKHIGKTQVTGLGFCKVESDDSTWLWVATEKNLRSYKTNTILGANQAARRTSFTTRSSLRLGEVEPGPELDSEGCSMHCGCVAKPPLAAPTMASPVSFSTLLLDENSSPIPPSSPSRRMKKNVKRKAQFVLGKSDRVEYFSPEDPGSVYAVSGDKKRLFWFRDYLVVVTDGSGNPVASSTTPTAEERRDVLQLYDFRNKFIALGFSLRGDGIGHVEFIAKQWNRLLVFTSTKRLFVLKEKDTQTKLDDLFRRNLYSTAISLASSSGCSRAKIMDIYKMYGDHLYSKGSYDEAVTQYCRTIGQIEPSYVIRRFLDSQRIENLTTYLEALHTHPEVVASGDHTTLLLNCYTKQKNESKLEKFIRNKNITKQIDVEAAVMVLRTAHYFEQALLLACEHREHVLCLQIYLEELGRYDEALQYLRKLDLNHAKAYLKEYGKMLMGSLPEETTRIITELCCSPEKWVGGDAEQDNNDVVEEDLSPESFIHIFVDHSVYLNQFLQSVVDAGLASPLIWNTFLELLLSQVLEKNQPDAEKRKEAEAAVMNVLKNPGAEYDDHHALVLVQSSDFRRGQLFLYEKLQMYHMLIRYYMEIGDSASILAKCKTYGVKDPNLWVQVLMYFAKKKATEDDLEREIQEVLHHIERLRIVPPLVVVEILSSNEHISLSTIRPYILSQLGGSQRLIDEHNSAIQHLKKDTESMKREIQDLRTKPKVFTSTKCNLTGAPLELPTVHFLSGNSYNLSSLPGGGSAADVAAVATAKTNGPGPSNRLLEDPKCVAEQQSVSDIMQKLQQNAPMVDEEFFNQLEISHDGFATVSEYFSKCLFESGTNLKSPVNSSSTKGLVLSGNTTNPISDKTLHNTAAVEREVVHSGGNPFL